MHISKFTFPHNNIAYWSAWQRLTIILLAYTLSIVISYVLSIKLFYRQLQNARIEENRLKRNFTQLQQQLGQMQAYKEQLQQSEKILQTVNNDLTNYSRLPPAMLAKIAALGESAGLHIRHLQPLTIKRQRFFSVVPLKIDAQGHFQEVLDFVNALAQNKNYTLLGDFRLSKSPSTTDESLLDCTFVVNMILQTMPAPHNSVKEK